MVTRRIGLVCGAAAVMMALSVTAFAQGGGGRGGFGQGRGGFGGGLRLLTIKDVQEELKMTQPQIDKVGAKQQEVQQAMQEVFQGGGGQQATPEERQKMMAKIQEIQSKAVNDILDTKQQKRFHELEIQAGGIMGAINRKEVADQLKITDEQRQKMQDLQRAAFEEIRNSGFDFQNATPEERQKFQAKMQETQKANNEKAVALLTDAQKAKWKELTGEPFKGSLNAGFGGGGRRPRP